MGGEHERDNLAEEIGQIVKEMRDFRVELKSFYVDREQHYKDHYFLKELREWVSGVRSTTIRTVVTVVVVSMVGLMVGGFILWGKKNIGQ